MVEGEDGTEKEDEVKDGVGGQLNFQEACGCGPGEEEKNDDIGEYLGVRGLKD